MIERVSYCSRDYECDNFCGSYSKASSSCSCHPACELFRDCCYNTLDYTGRCTNSNDTDHFIDDVLPKFRNFFQCTTDVISDEKYWMISKCPESWTGLNECDVTGNDTDVFVGRLDEGLSSIPVLSRNGLTYRNIYCALCHGEDISGLSPWTFNAEGCEDNDLFAADNLTTKELIVLLREQCKTVAILPRRNHPYHSLSVIPCREISGDFIDTCDEIVTNGNVQNHCSTIAAPLYISGSIFRNTFCAECYYLLHRNIQLEFVTSCVAFHNNTVIVNGKPLPIAAPPTLVSISITFNFGSQNGGLSVKRDDKSIKTTSVSCAVGQVFDPIDSKCKLLSCSEGYTLRNSVCEQLPDITTNYSEKCSQFAIKITTSSINYVNSSCMEIMECIFNFLPTEVVSSLQAIMEHNNFSCSVNDEEVLLESMTFSLEIIDSLFQRTENRYSTSADTSKSLEKIEIVAYCTSLSEDNLEQCNSEWLNETEWNRPDNVSDGIFILNNSSVAIDLSQVRLRHLFQFSSEHGNISSEEILVQYCTFNFSEMSKCPMVTLDSSLFWPLENDSSTLVYAPNTSIQFTSDMYTKLQNGKIQVCNFLISTGLVPFAFLPRYSDLQAIVSTAGIVLSLLALLVTLISYCMFPALRTRLENIAIMILCGCLIVAQLLLLFAGFATVHPILCSVVSGLGHFFWLSVFSSSNILGLLLIRTFGLRKEKTLRGKPPSKCSISIVMLICFVCPALISGTLLVLYYLDEDDLYGIIYGSTSGCWIGGPMINLYAFGIPVAVSLLINIIFFIHITISIFIQMKKSQRLRRKQSRVRELLIYVKVRTKRF